MKLSLFLHDLTCQFDQKTGGEKQHIGLLRAPTLTTESPEVLNPPTLPSTRQKRVPFVTASPTLMPNRKVREAGEKGFSLN